MTVQNAMMMMEAELVKRVVEACGWRAAGEPRKEQLRVIMGRMARGEI
jgi:hypothetical protein